MKKAGIILLIVGAWSFSSCNSGSTGSSASAVDNTTSSAQPIAEPYNKQTEIGQEIFRSRCVACHGLGGNAQTNNAANLTKSRADSLTIIQTIKNGRGAMPMFKDVISDTDMGHLAVYVKSLRR